MSLLWTRANWLSDFMDGAVDDEPPERPSLGHEYYHGTTRHFEPGERILPAAQHGRGSVFPYESSPEHAYATMNPSDAWHYAELAWNEGDPQPGDHPKVYRVRPISEHEHDPMYDDRGRSRGNFEGDVRSRHGFEVLDEVPMPEHMGRPKDWR